MDLSRLFRDGKPSNRRVYSKVGSGSFRTLGLEVGFDWVHNRDI